MEQTPAHQNDAKDEAGVDNEAMKTDGRNDLEMMREDRIHSSVIDQTNANYQQRADDEQLDEPPLTPVKTDECQVTSSEIYQAQDSEMKFAEEEIKDMH